MVTSGVRVSIAASTASRISGQRQQIDGGVDAPHHIRERRANRAFGNDKADAAEIGQTGEPGSTFRGRVEADHLFDVRAGDEIGDRRPPLQAEAAENRDLHAGSLRTGCSTRPTSSLRAGSPICCMTP